MSRGRGVTRRVQSITGDARGRFAEAREQRAAIDLAATTIRRFQTSDGTVLSGYLAYRLFILMIPLAAILVATASLAQDQVVETSEQMRLGAAVADSLRQAGSDVQRSRTPLLVSGISGFVIAAWGLLGGLQVAAARVWRIPTARFPSKGKAFLRLSGSLLLFGAVVYISAVVRHLGVVAGMAGSMAALTGFSLSFFGLGWLMPRRCDEWYWLLPGTAFGSAGAVALHALATFYLPNRLADSSATYGALGLTLTVLTYLFLLGVIIVMSTVVDAVVYERYRDDPPGLLRRAADLVPRLEVSMGSGYVPEGEAAEVLSPGGGAGPR